MSSISIHPNMNWSAAIRDLPEDGTAGAVFAEPGEYRGVLNLRNKINVHVICTEPDQFAFFNVTGMGKSQAVYFRDAVGIYMEGIRATGGNSNVYTGSGAHEMHFNRCEALSPEKLNGNQDCFKISQTNGGRFQDCYAEHWGYSGSGIDAVGCVGFQVDGFHTNSTWSDGPNHGIQFKVLSRQATITNFNIRGGGRGLNLGDKAIHVENGTIENAGTGITWYDARRCTATNIDIINPVNYAVSFFATVARAEELGPKHHRAITMTDVRVLWEEGFLTQGAVWVGANAVIDQHKQNTYRLFDFNWLNLSDPSNSEPQMDWPEIITRNWTFGGLRPDA